MTSRKALLYSMNIYPICDSISEIGAAQIRSVTEIAPKSPFLYVKAKALYGMVFVRAKKNNWYSVETALDYKWIYRNKIYLILRVGMLSF